jgi:hypothetical protein
MNHFRELAEDDCESAFDIEFGVHADLPGKDYPVPWPGTSVNVT